MGVTNTPSDLLPGTLELLILKALEGRSLHGYGIVERLRVTSGDGLRVGESALYPALREEMETHRALRQDALERAGMEPGEAVLASRRALGSVALAVEDVRDVWILRVIDATWHDVRAAFRGLRKSPAFASVAIGTLALGIGANTALFSILNSLLLRPLPVRDPGSLVLLTGGSWTYPIWEEIRRYDGQLFNGVFAWAAQRFDLSPGGPTQLVDGAYVSGRFFEVLGVSASRGRLLTPEDDAGAPAVGVAVISHTGSGSNTSAAPTTCSAASSRCNGCRSP